MNRFFLVLVFLVIGGCHDYSSDTIVGPSNEISKNEKCDDEVVYEGIFKRKRVCHGIYLTAYTGVGKVPWIPNMGQLNYDDYIKFRERHKLKVIGEHDSSSLMHTYYSFVMVSHERTETEIIWKNVYLLFLLTTLLLASLVGFVRKIRS